MKVDLLKKGHRCRPGGGYAKRGITVHSTGNPDSTAANERAWLDNPSNNREASWHYVVDENEIIQAIPETEEAWHCGKAEGNRFTIGIEICESGSREQTLHRAAEFIGGKLTEYGWDIACLKRHYDWTGKNCPRILIDPAYIKNGMDWAWFLKRIENYMKGGEEKEMNVEEAKKIIQERCKFDNHTMMFLSMYRYGDQLLTRLAEQLNRSTGRNL